MAPMLRLGVVGLGRMGQGVHLQNFLRIPECQVVAVADARADLARAVAQQYHIPRATARAEELIDAPDLDALVLVLPPQLNPVLGIPALEAGKHLFVEKPLAIAAAEGRALAAAAARCQRVLTCAYMKRYDAGVAAARALVEQARASGDLGAIEMAEIEYCDGGDWIRNYDPPRVDSDQPRPPAQSLRGGGLPAFVQADDAPLYYALVADKCHQVNLMRWLLGDPRELAFARLRSHAPRQAWRLLAVFDYGSFDCTLRVAHTAGEQWWEQVTVHFQRGWLRLELPPPLAPNLPARVLLYRAGSGLQEIAPTWEWAFRREAQHFVQCALGRAANLSPGDDSARDLLIFETIYRRCILGDSQARWPLSPA